MQVSTRKAKISVSCKVGTKANTNVFLARFYSAVETDFLYTHEEKLLGVKHFTMSPIRSSVYIPLIVLLPDGL
jgi:hypothetical protein